MPVITTCLLVGLFAAGVVLLSSGAVVYSLLPPLIRKRAREELTIDTPTSFGFDAFANRSSKADIFQTFYVYHCNNPDGVVHHGARPNLTELGPFVYLTTQWRNVDNISWHANATIEYTYHETYEFMPALSGKGLSESMNVTSIDLGVVGAMFEVRKDPILFPLIKALVVAEGYNVLINLTVREILFGYNNSFLAATKLKKDPFITIFTNDDPATFAATSAMYSGGCAANGAPQPLPNSYGQMTRWEGYDTLPYWNSPYANMINGTDGSSYPPDLKPSDVPYVFVDSLYRSVRMSCVDDSVTYEGVDLLRFTLLPDDLLSMHDEPNNAAFFMEETGFFTSPPIINHPIYFSKPRYLDTNHSRVKLLIAPPMPSSPSVVREMYDTIQDVEPIMGILFNVHKRIQLNVYLETQYNTSSSDQVATWFPILWLDENMQLPDNLVDDFKTRVLLPLHASEGAGIAGMALGITLIIVAVGLGIRRRLRGGLSSKEESIRNEEKTKLVNV